MVEPMRKHGAFDTRYPVPAKRITPAWVLQPNEGLLEWEAFTARYFPSSRRHDLDALAAYGAYRTAFAQAPPRTAPPSRRVRPTPRRRPFRSVTPAIVGRKTSPASRALASWEWEGGAPEGGVPGS
jgi:hypothetical protein